MPEGKCKKRKKSYYISSCKKKRGNQENLKAGMKGYLITCNGDNAHRAVKEAYRILNEYADIKYGPEFPEKDGDSCEEEGNLEDALKKEVSDIKDANKPGAVRRFQSCTTKGKSVVFIKAGVEDHDQLLHDIFTDLLLKQIRKTQICLRFYPVVATCQAKSETIIDCVKKCVGPVMVDQDIENVIEFCITFKSRLNGDVKRDDVLLPLVEYIYSSETKHVTNYKTPQLVISIDIIGGTCCISLLRNFFKFKKYNIDMLMQKEVDSDFEDEKPVNEENKLSNGNTEEMATSVTNETPGEQIADETPEKGIASSLTDETPEKQIADETPEKGIASSLTDETPEKQIADETPEKGIASSLTDETPEKETASSVTDETPEEGIAA